MTASCSSSLAQVARSRRIDSSSAGPDRRVELRRARRSAPPRATRMSSTVDPVEALAVLADRVEPAGADRLADRMHRRHRRLDVEVGAGHGCAVVDASCGRLLAGRCAGSWADSTSRAPVLPDPATGLDYVEDGERHAADVPAERGAVPRRERAAQRLRGPLPRAGAPPAAGRGPGRAARSARSGSARATRSATTAPSRCTGSAAGCSSPRSRRTPTAPSTWSRSGSSGSSSTGSTPPGTFPVGHVTDRPDTVAPVPESVLERARIAFTAYRAALADIRSDPYDGALPRDPTYLSWTLAALAPLPMPERQSLLEAEDADRAADPGHRPAARRAARDERDPVAAGHRGGPHPLVAELSHGRRSPPAVRRPPSR